MSDRAFLDTNILIYAVSRDTKQSVVAKGLINGGGVTSVQVLNEFTNVARRKLRLAWPELIQALQSFRLALAEPPLPIQLATHEAALRIAQRYGFSFYDSLIVSAALEGECTELLSEDFQDGQIIDGRLTIRNPFAAA